MTDLVPVDVSGSRNAFLTSPSPADIYLASLAPGSRRTMFAALRAVVEITGWNRVVYVSPRQRSARHGTAWQGAAGRGMVWRGEEGWEQVSSFPWHLLRAEHTSLIREALVARYSPATVNKSLAALRRVLAEAWRMGQMSSDDYHRAADVAGIKSERLPAGRSVSGGELRALFGACAPGPAGQRDAAALAILYGGGLRRAEAVALELADFDATEASLTVRSGKGRKDRTAHLPTGAVVAIQKWLSSRGEAPGALLTPVDRSGAVHVRPMSTQALYARLGHLSEAAGVSHLSPHDLRRSFVSDLLDGGADIALVAGMAGHASVTTTARYDRRPEAAKARAASLLHVPI